MVRLRRDLHVNCAKCGQPLEPESVYCSRCGTPTAKAAGGDDPTHIPGQAGEVLDGKWKLERKIGEGGMGAVYLAHDLQLDRKVAIKLLAPALTHDADLVTRFDREAKMTARLEHPNIVPIYAVGRAGARPFMVMKLLEGNALSSLLRKKGTLGRDELLPLVRQVAAGLDFIHSRGFIHRDIKTGNIFVGPHGEATILDFGILRPTRNAEAMTRTGMVMGTPQYMSPEQALGIRDIDHRADLYALAIVIYECITGVIPFEADSDLKVIQMQAHSPPPEIQAKAPWVPPEVSAVMRRALAKRPEDRFATAGELSMALEAAFGVHLMTGPGGIPVMASAPAATPGFPSIPGMVAVSGPGPAPGPSAMPAGDEPFPIPLEPTPPAPGERAGSGTQPGPYVVPAAAFPKDDRTRPSRPSGLAQAEYAEAAAAPHPAPRARPRGVVAAGARGLRAAAAPVPAPRSRPRWVVAAGAIVLLAVAGSGVFIWRGKSKVDLPMPPPPPVAEVLDASVPDQVAVALPAAVDAGAPELASEDAGTPGGAIAEADPALEPVPLTESPPTTRPHSTRPRPVKAGMGQVNVITTFRGGPYWAALIVNGEKRGTTPALLELPAGKNVIRIERTGFKTIEKQIKVASGRSAVLRIELVP